MNWAATPVCLSESMRPAQSPGFAYPRRGACRACRRIGRARILWYEKGSITPRYNPKPSVIFFETPGELTLSLITPSSIDHTLMAERRTHNEPQLETPTHSGALTLLLLDLKKRAHPEGGYEQISTKREYLVLVEIEFRIIYVLDLSASFGRAFRVIEDCLEVISDCRRGVGHSHTQ